MSYKDEQLSKYINNIYHLNEKNAVAAQIDNLRKNNVSDEEIRKMSPYFAQELDRQASNINVKDSFDKVNQAKSAAQMAQDLANIHQSDKYDAAADRAKGNVFGAEQDLEAAKAQAKINAEKNRQSREEQNLADLNAYNAAKKAQAKDNLDKKAYDAMHELEKTKQELEQAKKELEELKAKAAQGDASAAQEAEKVEDVVEQKSEEVKEEQAQVENAETTADTTVPPTAETLSAGAEASSTPAETAQTQANAEEAATQSAMEIKPTDTPEIQQAKQNFQQEWADLKTQIGSIQDTTKKLMASPMATSYIKQRPDLATKFQKFGGALAAMGSIVGLAGMITMFINPALGGILSAAGRTMMGAGGATASGASAVKQFKNGNVLGGIGSLAAAGMSGAMAGMGAKSLAGGISAMQAANAAPAVTSGTTDAMAGDPRFVGQTDAVSRDPAANSTATPPISGNATQSFTPGSNPAQFTNREPTIANTNDAVANAHPGDVLQRNDGTRIEINQGDIDWAKAHQPQPVATPTASAATVDSIPNTDAMRGDPRFAAPNNGPLFDYNSFKQQTTPNFGLNFNNSQPNLGLNVNPTLPNLNLNNPNVLKGNPNVVNPLLDYNNYKAQPVVPKNIGNQYFSNPTVI